MKNTLSKVNAAANWTARKAGAAIRLAGGTTGMTAASVCNLAGAVVAVSGGVVAVLGAGVYVGGKSIMGAASRLDQASTLVADKAYEDLRGSRSDEYAVQAMELEPEPTCC